MTIDSVMGSDPNEWSVLKTFNYYSLPTGVAALETDINPLKIYPNPVNDIINIETTVEPNANCEILNSSGQHAGAFNVTKGRNAYDISFLKNGVYFVIINTPSGVVTKKIIKR